MNDKTSSTNAYIVSLVCVFHAVFSIKCAYFACSARDVRCLQCMYRYLLYIEVRCYFFPLHSRMWQICDILKDELLLRYSTRQILRLSSKPLLIFVEAVFDSLEIPRSYLFWWCLPFLLCTLLDWVALRIASTVLFSIPACFLEHSSGSTDGSCYKQSCAASLDRDQETSNSASTWDAWHCLVPFVDLSWWQDGPKYA